MVKERMAALGTCSHGIERIVRDDKSLSEWKMVRLLSGFVPCAELRHTGEVVASLSEFAWDDVHLEMQDIFRAKSDRGSNMIKGWEQLSLGYLPVLRLACLSSKSLV